MEITTILVSCGVLKNTITLSLHLAVEGSNIFLTVGVLYDSILGEPIPKFALQS